MTKTGINSPRAREYEMDTTDLFPHQRTTTGFRVTTDMPFFIGVLLVLLIFVAIVYFIYRCSEFGCRLW